MQHHVNEEMHSLICEQFLPVRCCLTLCSRSDTDVVWSCRVAVVSQHAVLTAAPTAQTQTQHESENSRKVIGRLFKRLQRGPPISLPLLKMSDKPTSQNTWLVLIRIWNTRSDDFVSVLQRSIVFVFIHYCLNVLGR